MPRPPPKKGIKKGNADADYSTRNLLNNDGVNNGIRGGNETTGFHWTIRSVHQMYKREKAEVSRSLLTSSHVGAAGAVGGGVDGEVIPEESPTTNTTTTSTQSQQQSNKGKNNNNNNNNNKTVRKNQRAADIFAPSNRNDDAGVGHDDIRVGIVDGNDIVFELQEGVNDKPTIDRQTRLQRHLVNINVVTSSLETQTRFWLMKLNLLTLACYYLAAFVILNTFFAALFYIEEGNCCDDPVLVFAEVFDFTVQTSTTIGYGGYVPIGRYSNFLVVMLSFAAMLLNTIFAGLYFAKFVTPTAKIIFADVMTLSNVNGLPCLQIRVGNADGTDNNLSEATARLTFTHGIKYEDQHGTQQLGHTEELSLLNDRLHNFSAVWTLRHVIDETSPLFGLNFSEYPGNGIYEFRILISAVHDITKTPMSEQTGYLLEDIMIGYNFEDQQSWDGTTRTATINYSKMNSIVPQPVWYPSSTRRPEDVQ